MTRILLVLALAAAVHAGSVVNLPYTNPAGVTYINGGPAGYAVDTGAHFDHGVAAAPAGPVLDGHAYAGHAVDGHAYAGHALAGHGYAGHGLAGHGYAGHGYAGHGHAHLAAYAPAPVIGKVPAVAHVPAVSKVPAVADVPVTTLHATPGVVGKFVDVAHPAVSKRRFQVRRPAIRKEYYDIEQTIRLRPVGSTLLELETPRVKTQLGPAVIAPSDHVPAGPVVAAGVGRRVVDGPVHLRGTLFDAPAHIDAPEHIEYPQHGGVFEGVEVNAADFRAVSPSPSPFPQFSTPAPSFPSPSPLPQAQSRGAPPQQRQQQPQQARGPAPRGPAPQGPPEHARSLPIHESAHAQEYLHGILESPPGPVLAVEGGPGPVTSARVLEAFGSTANLPLPGEERMTSRRIALLRNVETVQDVEVNEPATKLHRLHVEQPVVYKTAHTSIARVPTHIPVATSVPVATKVPAVVGHAYPAHAHAHLEPAYAAHGHAHGAYHGAYQGAYNY